MTPGTQRRRRTVRIRVATIACSLVAFAAAWSAIYVQMVTGNDPALSATVSNTAESSTDNEGAASDTTNTGTTTTGSDDSAVEDSTDSSSSSSDLAVATSSQS